MANGKLISWVERGHSLEGLTEVKARGCLVALGSRNSILNPISRGAAQDKHAGQKRVGRWLHQTRMMVFAGEPAIDQGRQLAAKRRDGTSCQCQFTMYPRLNVEAVAMREKAVQTGKLVTGLIRSTESRKSKIAGALSSLFHFLSPIS